MVSPRLRDQASSHHLASPAADVKSFGYSSAVLEWAWGGVCVRRLVVRVTCERRDRGVPPYALLSFTSVALLLRRANNNTCSSRRLSPQHPLCTRVCLNLTYSDLAPAAPCRRSCRRPSSTRSNRQQGYHRKTKKYTRRPLPPRWEARVSHVTSPFVRQHSSPLARSS